MQVETRVRGVVCLAAPNCVSAPLKGARLDRESPLPPLCLLSRFFGHALLAPSRQELAEDGKYELRASPEVMFGSQNKGRMIFYGCFEAPCLIHGGSRIIPLV